MKDILGNELKLGDTVVTNETGYADLRVGKIIKFTPKACRVEYRPNSNDTKLCQTSQIALVEEEVAIVYWLKKSGTR
jgi:hypothetical protein